MGEFPSGQRGQTVNLLASPSMVRIRPLPPKTKPSPYPGEGFVFCVWRGEMRTARAIRKWQKTAQCAVF